MGGSEIPCAVGKSACPATYLINRQMPVRKATLAQSNPPSMGLQSAPPVPNIQPFAIEPIILARLNRANISPGIVGIVVGIVSILTVTWTALISNLFYTTSTSKSWWHNLWSFLLRNPATVHSKSVPYLGDYPSVNLTVTIALSVYLVYALFCAASVLHSDMASAGCIRSTEAGRQALTEAVNATNVKFRQRGRFGPLAFILSLAATTILNFRLEGRLFAFLGEGDLYKNWWASLHPVRPGGVIWVLSGTIGVYMVYAESVLGLTYVRFLRSCRNDYRFRANMLNPDGLFGWTRIRQIVSNLEAGVLCTLLSAWALSFYLQPALGSVITVVVLLTFGGIVLYVFISVTANFRRQVREDKDAQRAEIGREITEGFGSSEATSLLKTLVAYKRLDLVSKIPSVPIRPGWLIVGAVTVVVPVIALILQVLSYFRGK